MLNLLIEGASGTHGRRGHYCNNPGTFQELHGCIASLSMQFLRI